MNKEFFLKYGFKYVGACNCSGTFTEKYFDGRYTIAVKPKRRIFKISENNMTIVPLTNWIELENLLNAYERKKTF